MRLSEAFPDVKEEQRPRLRLVKASEAKPALVACRYSKIPAGNRNTTLYKRGCGLRAKGLCDEAITAQLHWSNVNICEEPLPTDEVNGIIQQVLKYEQGEMVSDARDEFESSGDELFQIESWGELAATPAEEPNFLLHGLCRMDVGMIQAKTNDGKSIKVQNLGISVACGRSYHSLLKKAEPLRVMDLDFETPLSRYREQVEKMLSVLSDAERELVNENFFPYVAKRRGTPLLNLSDKEHLQRLRGEIINKRIDLVIIDTLTAAFKIKNENDNAEAINEVMKPLEELAKETNTVILFTHHIGKAGLEDTHPNHNDVHRGRGASAYGDKSVAIFQLSKKKNRQGELVTVFSNPKAKDEQLPELSTTLNPETLWFEETGDNAVFTNSEENYRKLLSVITKPMTLDEIKAETPFLSDSTRFDYLKKARQAGAIEQPKKGIYQPLDFIPFDTQTN